MNEASDNRQPTDSETGCAKGHSDQRLVRRRGRRGRTKRGWPASRVKEPKPQSKAEPQWQLSESEFVEWMRKLADDPKWKNPTSWDEHTFRVGVQLALKRVSSPNEKGQR